MECFIDGTLRQLEEGSAELSDWMAMNNLIQSWIFNTLEQSLALQVSYMDEAKHL